MYNMNPRDSSFLAL